MAKQLKKKQSHKTLFEFIRYNLSGGIQFGWQYLFFFILGPGAAQLTLGETAFTIISSYVIYFVLSKQWVFANNGKRKTSGELIRFSVLMVTNLVVNIFVLNWLNELGFLPYITQLLISLFLTAWNYVWLKFWVFPSNKTTETTKTGKVTKPKVR
jgi:putative flippase GtrA